MPDTNLILHVKGTEAQTAEFPKEVVRAGISTGEITHSQLIWSKADNAWKQVRELPDLLPGERLILHVKGTEAQTTELAKEAIRAGVSQGQITHSQLIWSTADNSWKPLREWPDLLPGERLILHVKGTESETSELPKQAIRSGISKGEITHSQLIWSPAENAWKQVRELPDLLPSQKLAPAPSRAAPEPTPADAIIPESPTGPVVRATAPAAAPRVRVAAAAPVAVRPRKSLEIKELGGSNPLKWICIGLGTLILLIIGANFLLVDQPLRSNLAQTAYADVSVHAHFGAFMQPNVIVIHIPASTKITPDKLVDFLVTLAHSTPQNPITGDYFDRVALTSGWTAQFTIAGNRWKELGDMAQEDDTQRKDFIMSQMADAGGQPLIQPTLNEAAKDAISDQVWAAFAAPFTAKR
jgi:hypothetical protein